MTCPVNGPRNISEFVWAGEVKFEPMAATDAEWTEFVFLENNRLGPVYEWWLHAPTNTWFIALRDTARDEVIETMTVDAYLARQAGAQT
jgi:sarcosine oxidase subunit delta